ncbi:MULTISPECIES: hypothetical protein [Vibrio]|uniref:Nitrate/nitrite sensing protein domain-containing protein n=2 Tax=Vibrio TaxID=662 RepID=A0A7X4LK74_9VIBR|nr:MULTISPECIES: hypothetical protein [Vibrio]MBF8999856.1 hypothetical protein [Vibrio nitrifigilis]MZI93439.1 hypothetical protein [Vibrio eleionomae]
MFVLLAMAISLAILGLMYLYAKQRENVSQRKYELLVELREVLSICRQHRSATHHQLMFGENNHDQALELEHQLQQHVTHLIHIANLDTKPMYRILQRKLEVLTQDWQDRSVARNQMLHGRAIRHCMFLLDEVILAWLLEAGREDLSDEYHINWQQVIDAMDALTQLRITIDVLEKPNDKKRFFLNAGSVYRKVTQLSMISSLTIASPHCAKALRQLLTFEHQNSPLPSAEELYAVTTALSLAIAQVYDHMLSELIETLYIPLPKLVLA